MSEFYFRCKSNPKGPVLKLSSYWEAKEMENHPDYERINEFGDVIATEESEAPHPMPFNLVARKA